MKKAVLFDLDDTLSDGSAAYSKALEAAGRVWANKYPAMNQEKFTQVFSSARSDVFSKIGGSANAGNRLFYFQRIMEQENLPHDYKWLLMLNNIYWREYLKWIKPRDGAAQTLSKLRKMGIKIGVVTNLTAEIQARKLVAIRLDKYINIMVSAEEAGVTKPNPKIFQIALERAGVSPNETVMVGDDIAPDIKGASDLGMETVLIENNWHVYTEEERSSATYSIKNLREIISIVA